MTATTIKRMNQTCTQYDDLAQMCYEAMQKSTRLHAENERLRAEKAELVDDLEDWASQHKCGCEHPACNQCGRDEFTRKLLATHQPKRSEL